METPSAPDPNSLNELIESTHSFPGVYKIKAIGDTFGDFEKRLVSAVQALVTDPSDLEYSARTTPGGRHVAVTMEVTVQSAEQILAIYAAIRDVEGLTLLL